MFFSKKYLSIKKINPVLFISLTAVALACTHRHADQPLFTQLPSSLTGITFNNTLTDHDSLNILDYLYYYNGGGVAVGDINNDGLPDIYFTANSKGNNKLYLNKGNFQFEDITEKAGVAGTCRLVHRCNNGRCKW